MNKALAKLFHNETFAIAAGISILTLLAYGLFAPRIGFYWDDWPYAYLHRFYGPGEFLDALRTNRPFLGPIFAATTFLFGGNPFTWQIVGLVTRFLISFELYFLLRLAFPSQKTNVLWVVLLFTVYPGYSQQWVAFTHVNQEFIPLLLLLGSFWITMWLLRNRGSKWLLLAALLLQAFGLLSTEYFFGLEVIRFFLILKIFAEKIKGKKELLLKAINAWLPYIIVWLLIGAGYLFFYRSGAYSSYAVEPISSALLSPVSLVNEFITTLSLSAFMAWLRTFNLFAAVDGTSIQVFSAAILAAVAILVFLFVKRMENKNLRPTQTRSTPFGWWAMAIGLVGIFAGRLPSWAAGFNLRFDFDRDRLFVSIMLGASLFIIGLADLILKEGKTKLVALSLLIGLCASQQVWTADAYRRDWQAQRLFFWELTWRMPAIEENTVLLADELPFSYVFDLHLAAPLNWAYGPPPAGDKLPYMLFYPQTRLGGSLPSLEADTTIIVPFRTVSFNGNTSRSITIYKGSAGCLRVLDPVYAGEETVVGGRKILADAIRLSDTTLIISNTPPPALEEYIFGKEPEHGWCFYYAKAELARQEGEWEKVVEIHSLAHSMSLVPNLPVENLPFIEGFARTGDLERAIDLTVSTLDADGALCPALTTLWERVADPSGFKPDCN